MSAFLNCLETPPPDQQDLEANREDSTLSWPIAAVPNFSPSPTVLGLNLLEIFRNSGYELLVDMLLTGTIYHDLHA